MNERPIIFNSEMVIAILDGRKTQTRRLMKIQQPNKEFKIAVQVNEKKPNIISWVKLSNDGLLITDRHEPSFKCPFGKIGDRLYVRETWAKLTIGYVYKAEDSIFDNHPIFKWKPSIYMPKSAARIWLEITDIRVERVQDINGADAIKEGVTMENVISVQGLDNQWKQCINNFSDLWNSIYNNWNDNPWVWVIEFKRINKK